MRKNFIQPSSPWAPYAQIEAGALYNDGFQDQTQGALGQALEFQIGAGVGVRYLCQGPWAIFVEADYRHISNAGLATRNAGTNAIGGFAGISRFY